jgi:hypothetical protein
MTDYEAWCARKVEAESGLFAQKCALDVWPSGWSYEQKEEARRIGKRASEPPPRDEDGDSAA